MHRSEHARPRHRPTRSGGFTLVESVVVIALTGVLAAVVSLFIVKPVQAYMATSARAELVDQADLALRRIGRDLRLALPNSARVTGAGMTLELIPTTGGARFASEGSGRLDFGSADSTFDLVGPGLTLAASQDLVFYNLGSGVVGSDAYAPNGTATEQASSNRRSYTGSPGPVTTVSMNALAALPAAANSPPYRVLAVSPPVTYRCDLAAGTLTRYSGYGFQATQADPPIGGNSAVMATGVSACRFTADGTLVAARAALVGLSLTLSANTGSGTESVSLYHASYVDNLP